ncbi:MAG: hypothetical protein GX081_08210 [Firmicutes bacterium]|nr:hypothetical protein [Bacillota bacterium]
MKKVLFGAIIFILMISLLSGCGKKEKPYVYEGVELLKNGKFEEIDPKYNFPKSWDKWGKGGEDENNDWIDPDEEQLEQIKYIVDNEAGNTYIKIDTKTKEENYLYVFQTYRGSIPVGKKLKLAVRIKTENLTGEGAAIAIRCDDAVPGAADQFVTTQGKIQITGTKDWTTYTVELGERVRSDIEAITVFLLYLPKTSGVVYFDDASLIY